MRRRSRPHAQRTHLQTNTRAYEQAQVRSCTHGLTRTHAQQHPIHARKHARTHARTHAQAHTQIRKSARLRANTPTTRNDDTHANAAQHAHTAVRCRGCLSVGTAVAAALWRRQPTHGCAAASCAERGQVIERQTSAPSARRCRCRCYTKHTVHGSCEAGCCRSEHGWLRTRLRKRPLHGGLLACEARRSCLAAPRRKCGRIRPRCEGCAAGLHRVLNVPAVLRELRVLTVLNTYWGYGRYSLRSRSRVSMYSSDCSAVPSTMSKTTSPFTYRRRHAGRRAGAFDRTAQRPRKARPSLPCRVKVSAREFAHATQALRRRASIDRWIDRWNGSV